MKLYTRSEIIKMLDFFQVRDEDIIQFIDTLTPIVLPTEEEIRKESHNYFIRGQLGFEAAADTERAFLKGVLWMRDKIQGGDK